jgi:hypothetical protein
MNEDIPRAFRSVFVQVLQNVISRAFPVQDFLSSDSDEETEYKDTIYSPEPDSIWINRRLLKFIYLMSLNSFWADAMVNHLYIPNSFHIDEDDVDGFYDQCERIVGENTRVTPMNRLSRFNQNCEMGIFEIVSKIRDIYKSGPIQADRSRGNKLDYQIQSIQIIEDCEKIIQNLSIFVNRKNRKEFLMFASAAMVSTTTPISTAVASTITPMSTTVASTTGRFFKASFLGRLDWKRHFLSFI